MPAPSWDCRDIQRPFRSPVGDTPPRTGRTRCIQRNSSRSRGKNDYGRYSQSTGRSWRMAQIVSDWVCQRRSEDSQDLGGWSYSQIAMRCGRNVPAPYDGAKGWGLQLQDALPLLGQQIPNIGYTSSIGLINANIDNPGHCRRSQSRATYRTFWCDALLYSHAE